MYFNDLYDLDGFTLHPKIAKLTIKTNKNISRFQNYYGTLSSLLHVKPTNLKEFDRLVLLFFGIKCLIKAGWLAWLAWPGWPGLAWWVWLPGGGLGCPRAAWGCSGVAWGVVWTAFTIRELSGNYPGTIRELSGILGELAVGPCWPGWLGLAGLAWLAWLGLPGWRCLAGWLWLAWLVGFAGLAGLPGWRCLAGLEGLGGCVDNLIKNVNNY